MKDVREGSRELGYVRVSLRNVLCKYLEETSWSVLGTSGRPVWLQSEIQGEPVGMKLSKIKGG